MNIRVSKVYDLMVYSSVFDVIDSVMYIFKVDNRVFIIDPHANENIFEYISKNDDITIFLTHEHFDHISGVNWFRNNFKRVTVFSSAQCANKIGLKRNGTELFPLLLIGDRENYHDLRERYKFPYHCKIDCMFSGTYKIYTGNHFIELFETPGHTVCSISILVDNHILFAGDNLLGNEQEFRCIDSSVDKYQTHTLRLYRELIKNDTIVFPGHGKAHKIIWFLDRQEI